MVAVGGSKSAPVHKLAWFGFGLANVALVLAWYGSLHAEKHIAGSPLREARGSANVIAEPGPWHDRLFDRTEVSVFGERFDKKVFEATARSKFANYSVQFVAFALPFLLGLGAALIGSSAMAEIEESGGARSGNFQAVFAIMIGSFAAIITGCMILSVYLWPHLPSIYQR